MVAFSEIFDILFGEAHLTITLGKKTVAEISVVIDKKEIEVKLTNPLTLLELGLKEFVSNKGLQDIEIIKKLKNAGYKIKVKYKTFEFEI
jgi:hypothetical protein